MNFLKTTITVATFLSFIATSIQSRDILLEAKGAYFLSNNETFQNLYGRGSGQGGLELTGEFGHNIYGFFSVDFLHATGEAQVRGPINDSAQLFSTIFALGLKYFIPFEHLDLYLGLGIEPTYLSQSNQQIFTPDEQTTTKKFGCGGIAKAGVILNLPHSLFIDLFVDYSFIHFNNTTPTTLTNINPENKNILNGALFGLGFGYRFN